MKKLAFILIVLLVACNNGISKPDNLIPEDKMVNVLYDLYMIEGIRQSNPSSFQSRKLDPSEYILKKYKVDSLQFVNSDHWYAADTKRYQELYKRVLSKVDAEMKKTGAEKTAPQPSQLPPSTKSRLEKLRKMQERNKEKFN